MNMKNKIQVGHQIQLKNTEKEVMRELMSRKLARFNTIKVCVKAINFNSLEYINLFL